MLKAWAYMKNQLSKIMAAWKGKIHKIKTCKIRMKNSNMRNSKKKVIKRNQNSSLLILNLNKTNILKIAAIKSEN